MRMDRAPLILISPSIEPAGVEFRDRSFSLSEPYARAVMAAEGIPVVGPAGLDRSSIAECVRRCDGVLLSGGDDVEPELYRDRLSARLRKTVETTPDEGERTLRELYLIDEIFRQRKPTLAICRGSQLLNVALGGTLVVDIEQEVRGALNHRRMDRRSEVVHEIALKPGSVLAGISGKVLLSVNSTHHQAVGGLAGALQVSGASSDGVVEAIELRPRFCHWLPFLVAVQYHPERLADRYPEHAALFRAFVHACIQDRRKQKNQIL